VKTPITWDYWTQKGREDASVLRSLDALVGVRENRPILLLDRPGTGS